MKQETKQARLAALLGIEMPKPVSPREKLRQANISREAEAVILYAESPSLFLRKFCRICKRDFAVNRSHIAFCSDDCRSIHLNDVIGLEWDPMARTVEERWAHQTGGLEPLIVPPMTLQLLQLIPEQTPEPDEDIGPLDIDALLAE
jgi:hypothetical protein